MNIWNKFMVGTNGHQVTVLNPPTWPISQDEAILFAAWLVVVAGGDMEKFSAALAAIEGK